jgi:hypothetical protein
MGVKGVLPAASSYATIKAFLASSATPASSDKYACPSVIVTSACPVKAVPSCSPISPPPGRLPLIVVGPVFVIVVPAKTAKLEVFPMFTVGWAAITLAGAAIITNSNSVSSNGINLILLSLFIGLLPLHLFIYFYQYLFLPKPAIYLSPFYFADNSCR